MRVICSPEKGLRPLVFRGLLLYRDGSANDEGQRGARAVWEDWVARELTDLEVEDAGGFKCWDRGRARREKKR